MPDWIMGRGRTRTNADDVLVSAFVRVLFLFRKGYAVAVRVRFGVAHGGAIACYGAAAWAHRRSAHAAPDTAAARRGGGRWRRYRAPRPPAPRAWAARGEWRRSRLRPRSDSA